MPNTILNQQTAVSLQLTDYALLWQGGQSPSTRKMPISNLATYYLALTGGTVTGDVTFSAAKPKIAGNAGTVRAAQFLTGSTVRWQIDANATAESGTNAGSNFELWSYTDAGAQLTKVLAITRSSGAATFGAAVTTRGALTVNPSSGAPVGVITGDGSTYISLGTSTAHPLLAVTNNIERARLDAAGNLLFATTNASPATSSVLGATFVQAPGSSSAAQISNPSGAVLSLGTAASGALYIPFYYTGVLIGSVSAVGNGISVAYNTTSDARLKLDDGLIEAREAGRIIDRLRPRWFRFKAHPDLNRQPGFFAQQVHRVFPWAVTKGRKGQPWQMDAGKLMPVVIAELQALRRRVAELERGA